MTVLIILAAGLIGLRCVTCNVGEIKNLPLIQAEANTVVQNSCFEKFMLSRNLVWTDGKTNEEVIKDIKNKKLVIPVHYYDGYKGLSFNYPKGVQLEIAETTVSECDGVIGYRNPPAPDVYFNRCYHKDFSKCQAASNATHEWSHVLGYDHSFKPTEERPYTVPYSINAAFTECCLP